MTRLWLVALLLACACRRSHPATTYESDHVAAPAPPAAEPAPAENAPAATPGGGGTPGEPVAPGLPMAAMPDGGTLNGDPRGPRPAEYDAVVAAAMPALQACFDKETTLPLGEYPVTIHYTVEMPGYTGGITAKGPAPEPVLDCCVAIVKDLKFPQYRGGAKVARDLSFTYWKRDKNARDLGVAGGSGKTTK